MKKSLAIISQGREGNLGHFGSRICVLSWLDVQVVMSTGLEGRQAGFTYLLCPLGKVISNSLISLCFFIYITEIIIAPSSRAALRIQCI